MIGLSQLEKSLISLRTKEWLRSEEARWRNWGRHSKRNDKTDTVDLF